MARYGLHDGLRHATYNVTMRECVSGIISMTSSITTLVC
jgi:hypothetical protein